MPDDATARNGAAGFAVGSKGYVTTGYTVYKDDDPMHTGGYAYLKTHGNMTRQQMNGDKWMIIPEMRESMQ